jgi:mono/diheme cytochrome c family protein
MLGFPPRCWAKVLAILGVVVGPAAAQEPDAFARRLRPFFEERCLGCHGPELQKARLRLDTLAPASAGGTAERLWVRVFDRLSRGEMPPPSQPRPPETETRAVLTALHDRLQDVSLARQRREGRVPLRRLNRIQYESTLRDLLGTQVEVADLLPDDNLAAGFDRTAAALDISPIHLLRYQLAAETALRSALPDRPWIPFQDRRTGKQITEKMPLFRELLGNLARLDGDTLILYVRPYSHIPCATAPAPQSGRYRVRASVSAVGTGGRPLPLRFVRDDLYGRDESDVRGVRDVPADVPTVLEGEFDLKARQHLVLTGWSLPTMRAALERLQGKPLDASRAPGLAVQWVEIEGPLGAWPPPGYRRLFGDLPLVPASTAKALAEGRPAPPETATRPEGWWLSDPLTPATTAPREDAERLLRAFTASAFRRPVSPDVSDRFVRLVHDALDQKVPFAEAMLLGYKAVLCSPHFLLLAEPIDPDGHNPKLDDTAVAARLSYFLWSSQPDSELLQVAARGELTRPETLRLQVERLLDDPKSARFVADFAGQWLDLRKIDATSPDPQIYGEFDDFLFWSMSRETLAFVAEVLRADRPVTEFVDSNWTFLNQRLAQHYGIPDVFGGELRKVDLPAGCHRGGVLTQASVLKVTADGTRTSPVLRGKWVLGRILGRPPDPPPPDIPAIEPDIRGATTIRQQLDKHRHTPACASCHRQIDPPGFALENFDVIGGWRDFYRGTRGPLADLANYPGRQIFRGLDVEQGGETADGRAFQTIDDYKRILLADKDQLARNLIQKLIVYATGAEIQFADREVVEDLVAWSRQTGYRFRSLVHTIVQSRLFMNK